MAFVADRVHLGQGIVAFVADKVALRQGIVAFVADGVLSIWTGHCGICG